MWNKNLKYKPKFILLLLAFITTLSVIIALGNPIEVHADGNGTYTDPDGNIVSAGAGSTT